MSDSTFGTTYMEVAAFRSAAAMFGVGMALCDYPDTSPGNTKLLDVLGAASRAVDAFCAKSFVPDDRTEQPSLDLRTWQFVVNNPPVTEIVSCQIRYGKDGTVTIPPANIYINNQQGYCEIIRRLDGTLTILEAIGTDLSEAVIELVYKSSQSIPPHVALATGFQTAHLINSGFVDKTLPPNFGKLDIGGLSVNNKKGYRSSEEMSAGSFSPDAARLLTQEQNCSVA